jgi:hypothetical protein
MLDSGHGLGAFGGEETENQTPRGVGLIIFLKWVNLLIWCGLLSRKITSNFWVFSSPGEGLRLFRLSVHGALRWFSSVCAFAW